MFQNKSPRYEILSQDAMAVLEPLSGRSRQPTQAQNAPIERSLVEGRFHHPRHGLLGRGGL